MARPRRRRRRIASQPGGPPEASSPSAVDPGQISSGDQVPPPPFWAAHLTPQLPVLALTDAYQELAVKKLLAMTKKVGRSAKRRSADRQHRCSDSVTRDDWDRDSRKRPSRSRTTISSDLSSSSNDVRSSDDDDDDPSQRKSLRSKKDLDPISPEDLIKMSVDEIASAINRRFNSDASSSTSGQNQPREKGRDEAELRQTKAEARKSDEVDDLGFSPSARRAFKMIWEDSSSSDEDKRAKRNQKKGILQFSVDL